MEKKIKPPSERQYKKAEIELAFSHCPHIYDCSNCGWPVAKGFICNYCGSNNPRGNRPQSDL